MKEISCPSCGVTMPEDQPCEHYKKYGWKPGAGENEMFFIKLIQQNYEPGTFGRKWKKKPIGTSGGNTRTKNTVCTYPGCKKDLNGYSFDKIEKHKQIHIEQAKKEAGQMTL